MANNNVFLYNYSGQIIEVSLWGIRAAEFNGESVYKVGQTETIITIFVGTLYKGYSGMDPFLSETTACCWYINNGDIAEIENFYNRYVTFISKLKCHVPYIVHSTIYCLL
jgi:hypothetical protein